jgi:ubiquitin C-terminal hydrolase
MKIVTFYLAVVLVCISSLIGCTGCSVSPNGTNEKDLKRNPGDDSSLDAPYLGDVGGLPNIGNTCYFNSALQVLAHIDEFNKIFDYQGTDANKKQLADLGRKLVNNLKDKTKRAADNKKLVQEFYAALEKFGWYDLGGQQDLQELMDKIFSALDYNVLNGYLTFNGERTQPVGQFFKVYRLNDELSSMQDSVNNSLSEEVGGKLLKTFISADTSILTVFYQLADKDNPGYKIKCPHSTGVMKIFIPKDNVVDGGSGSDLHYSLVALIEHQGATFSGGHYVSYVKSDAQWYKYNDSSVSEVSDKEAEQVAESAYLYFYKKD